MLGASKKKKKTQLKVVLSLALHACVCVCVCVCVRVCSVVQDSATSSFQGIFLAKITGSVTLLNNYSVLTSVSPNVKC